MLKTLFSYKYIVSMCQNFIQFIIEGSREITELAPKGFEELELIELLGTEMLKCICWVRYKTGYYPIKE